jgi:E3 ubiquitin-protein ligase DRIP
MLLLIIDRPDHSLQHIRSLIFPAKRRKVFTMKKRKERVSSESTLSSVVGITAEGSAALTPATSESKAQKVVVDVIDEADEGLGD